MLRKVFASIAMITGGTATIGTVAAFFGGWWWAFDYLANFRWQLMWIGFVAAIVYALAGTGPLTAVFLVATAVNVFLILPVWTSGQPQGTGENTVRVAHIDISGSIDDLGDIESWLVGTDADLLLVAGATADDVAAMAFDDPYVVLTSPGDEPGIAVLGKDSWAIATTLSTDGQPVHRIAVPGGPAIISIVTSWGPMGDSQSAADALTARLTAVADVVGTTDTPVTVIGNFGATRWTNAVRTTLGAAELRDATTGAGYLPTWPHAEVPVIGRWMGIPIDIVYMSPEITPIEVIAGPDVGADHTSLTISISPITP